MDEVVEVTNSRRDVKRSFWLGTAWSFTSNVLVRGSAIAGSIITARILGAEGYGKLGLLQSTVGMLGVFAGFGLGTTATRYVAEYRRSDPERAGALIVLNTLVSLVLSIFIGLILQLGANWFAHVALADDTLARQMPNLVNLLIISTCMGVLNGALSGLQAYRRQAVINGIVGFVSLPITVLLVRYQRLDGAVSSLAVVSAINLAALAISMGRLCKSEGIPLRLHGYMRDHALLHRFALPILVSTALNIPVIWFSNTLLAHQPSGFVGLGIVNAANQWRAAILFLPMVIAPVTLPMLTQAMASHERAQMGAVLRLNMGVVGLASGALWVGISLCAGLITRMYGDTFRGGEMVVIIISLAAALQAINGIVGQVIAAFEKPWLGALFNGAWAIALISLSCILIPRYGVIGFAWAQAASFILHTIWQSVYMAYTYRSLMKEPKKAQMVANVEVSNA